MNEAIEIGTEPDGQPLARFNISCVGNLVLQAKSLRYEHSCERCVAVYSPPITSFEDLGWEFELHAE